MLDEAPWQARIRVGSDAGLAANDRSVIGRCLVWTFIFPGRFYLVGRRYLNVT